MKIKNIPNGSYYVPIDNPSKPRSLWFKDENGKTRYYPSMKLYSSSVHPESEAQVVVLGS